MRIDLTRITAANGDKIFMAHGQRGERFSLLTVSNTQISGYVGIAQGFEVPVVYPVNYRFGQVAPSVDSQDLIAKWMMAKSLDLYIDIPTANQSGLRDSANIWASFLGERVAEKPSELQFTLERGEQAALLSMRLINAAGSFLRLGNFQKGASVDGFTALTVYNAVARVYPRMEKEHGLNIEAAKSALASVPKASSQSVAYYGVKNPKIAELRLQAAQSYPVLAGLIADTPSLSRAVDNMEPIQELLTTRTGLSKASLKRIGKLRHKLPAGNLFERGERVSGEDAIGINRVRRTSTSGAILLDDCLRTLAKLPPDRTPQTDEDWAAYSLLLSGAVHPIANMLNIPEETLLEASKGSWEKWRGQIARAADFAPEEFSRQRITLSTIDALEALDDFSRTVIMPLVLRSIESTGQTIPQQSADLINESLQVAAEIILGKSKSQVSALAEIGRRYIPRIPALNIIEPTRDEGVDPSARWRQYGSDGFPQLTQDFTGSNGLVLYPFKDTKELPVESSRMTNCIGRLYLNAARTAASHLYSVRSADLSESFATLEIRGIPKEGSAEEVAGGLTIVQLLGKRNGTCPQEARQVVNEWMESIRRGETDLNIEEIRAWRENLSGVNPQKSQSMDLNWSSALGTDWRDEERSQAYWGEWCDIIGSPAVRGDAPGSLFRHAAVRNLVASLNPSAAAILVERAREEREAAQAPASPEI